MALPKPAKAAKGGAKKAAPEKTENKNVEKKQESKQEQAKQQKKTKDPKAKPKQEVKAATDEKPVDISRLSMKVGKIIECVKHPGILL